jgi:CheY-like chemotaxis protein
MNWRNDLDQNGSVAPHSPRVLVLDDNDVDRFAVCRALHESGIAAIVHDTGSAAQALDRIKTTTFDCLFIGDSIARTHLFSLLLALHQMEYRGRVVIVAYGVDHIAQQNPAAPVSVLSISSLTPDLMTAGAIKLSGGARGLNQS